MEKLLGNRLKGASCRISRNFKMQESYGMPNYDIYNFNWKEMIIYILLGIGVDCLFSYVFYKSLISVIILSPLILFVLRKKKKECRLKRKQKLTVEFREMMNSIVAALGAGYSVENAFINAYKDMILLFGKEAYITKELAMIAKALRNNRNIEELLEDFGRRSHVSDIGDFAEIFKIAKRSGGNLTEIIKSTASIINEKIETRRKIETIISAKQFEQKIMNFVPFGIILYLDLTSPGFFDGLYHNLTGIIIMTILLIIYILAYLLAEKITTIEM